MEHKLTVSQSVLDLYEKGRVLEVRLCTAQTLKIRPGHTLVLSHEKNSLLRRVARVERFKNFGKLLEVNGQYRKIDPRPEATEASVLRWLRTIHSSAAEHGHGVMAIELEVV